MIKLNIALKILFLGFKKYNNNNNKKKKKNKKNK